jgi:hypothetical protein
MHSACAILSSVACPALEYFSSLSHKRYDFLKKLLNKKCKFWFSLQLLSQTFLILRRIQRDIIVNVIKSSCQILMEIEFSRQTLKKKLQYQISWKWVQRKETYSLRTLRRTDTMNLRMVLAILRTRPRKYLNIVRKVFSSQNIQSEGVVLRDKASAVCQSVLLEMWFNSRSALSACCQGSAIFRQLTGIWHYQ